MLLEQAQRWLVFALKKKKMAEKYPLSTGQRSLQNALLCTIHYIPRCKWEKIIYVPKFLYFTCFQPYTSGITNLALSHLLQEML